MSKADIQEYLDFSEEIRDQLETSYQVEMFNCEYEKAHEIVKKLMEYKMIDPNDQRVSTKTKIFQGTIEHPGVNVKSPESWGVYDYRKIGTDFLPRYLYCQLRDYSILNLDVLTHWGKRVEGGGEGDVKISGFKHRLRMALVNKSQAVKNVIQEMVKLAKSQNTPIANPDLLLEESLVGCMRIYQITAMTPVEAYYNNFGYILVKMGDDGAMQARVLPNYKSILATWVAIPQYMSQLSKAIHEVIQDNDIYIEYITPPDEYGRQQAGMIKYSNETEESRKRILEKEETLRKQLEAEDLEKKAKKETRKSTTVIH